MIFMKITRRLTNNKAFTLIELLVVVTLTALAVGITGDILVSVTKSYNRTQVMNEVEQQANFVSSKLNRELRDAYSVESTNSNEIVVRTKNGVDNVKYYLNSSDSRFYRQVGTGTAVPLTSPLTKIEGVRVKCGNGGCFSINNNPPPYIVTYSLIFDKGDTATIKSTININDTVVLRGTY